MKMRKEYVQPTCTQLATSTANGIMAGSGGMPITDQEVSEQGAKPTGGLWDDDETDVWRLNDDSENEE